MLDGGLDMFKRRHFIGPTVTWLALTSWSVLASAYSTNTHQKVVDEGWQVIRALGAPSLKEQIRSHGMSAGTDADLVFSNPPSFCSLPVSDPRNLCGEQLTAQDPGSWNEFVVGAKTTMQKYFAQAPRLPTPVLHEGGNCAAFDRQHILGDFELALQAGALQEIPDSDLRNSCDYIDNWRRGVFQDFVTEDDGTGYQGLILGWHATSRDYDYKELWLDYVPVYGPLAKLGAEIGTVGIAATLYPFVCIWDFFFGGDCLEDAWDSADSVNPANVLTGILPGAGKDSEHSSETGVFHYINPQRRSSNEYDDIQGMLYGEAGPDQNVGCVDHAIIIGADTIGVNLDASNSDGTERYELIDNEVSYAKSDDRGDWNWQSEMLGHVVFTPLDNLAYYGDANFPRDGRPGYATFPGIYKFGWTLHAVADATVPMHCAGTTSWGHRPYEIYTEEHVDDLFYVTNNPVPGSPKYSNDQLKLFQLQQAQRVAAYAYRWYKTGLSDVRVFVTEVAKQTLAALSRTGTYEGGFDLGTHRAGTIWCDACSYGQTSGIGRTGAWIGSVGVDLDESAMNNWSEYYVQFRSVIQTNLERAAGASAAYLIRRAPEMSCKVRGEQCGGSQGNCCGSNAVCDSGTCREKFVYQLLPNGSPCTDQTGCAGGFCHKTSCVSASDCNGSGTCSSATCSMGVCSNPTSPTSPTNSCTSDPDCAFGSCVSNVCSPGKLGARCRNADDCADNQGCVIGCCGCLPQVN